MAFMPHATTWTLGGLLRSIVTRVTAILQSCRLQVSRATGKDFVMGTSGSCIREVHLRLPNAEVIVPCGAIRLCTIQHLRAIVVDVADEPVGWCHAHAIRLVRAQ